MLSPALIDEQALTLPELYETELPAILAGQGALPKGIRRVYALGNGDSYHAALAASEAFAEWTDLVYLPMPAYTFQTKELPRLTKAQAAETLVVCISASGSSKLAVSILTAVKEQGLGHTLSVSGKPGCAMDQAADWSLSVAIAEKGRSPGIRTYAASVCGLLQLACRLGNREELLPALSKQLQTEAGKMPALLARAKQTADRAVQWDWPLASVLGCDGLLGCAQFIAAKFAEGCGVYAAGQELEEWCHVESMTYPLNAPVVILHGGDAETPKALRIADTAHRAGRKVLLISRGGGDVALRDAADESVFMGLECEGALQPLFHYLPALSLISAIAVKLGRAMFLSDQPFKLF